MAVAIDGEIVLPTNPNGVVFAAPAADVLAARSWLEVQGLLVGGLEQFERDSGLAAMGSFSWRVATDRKNRRKAMVLALYVFDGPATAAHLRILETHMEGSPVAWGHSHIERLPPNCCHSLLCAGGRLHQLWDTGSGAARVRELALVDRGVVILEKTSESVEARDFLPGVTHVKGRPAGMDDQDTELERMRLVFSRHFAQRIIEADGRLREEELVFMDTVFPDHLLKSLDLDDDRVAQEWLEEALRRLPAGLGHHDKLALVGLFFSACYSDGSLDTREMRVLREAGEALGLTAREVGRYLERFW